MYAQIDIPTKYFAQLGVHEIAYRLLVPRINPLIRLWDVVVSFWPTVRYVSEVFLEVTSRLPRRGRQPYLFVWWLLVDHVRPMLPEL